MVKLKHIAPTAGIAIGIIAALISAVCLTAISAYLVLSETVEEHQLSLLALGILFISGFIGNMLGTKAVGAMPAVIGGITSLGILLILLGVHYLFLDSKIYGLGGGLLTILASFGLVCWINLASGSRKKKLRKRASR